jgi:hypothetical protein
MKVGANGWRGGAGLIAEVVSVCALVLAVCTSAIASEAAERSRYNDAVDYCRTKPGQLVLREDRSVFCFDGQVPLGQQDAIDYCRSKPGQVIRNPDQSILCHNGFAWPQRDVSSLNGLQEGGLFVVRSLGGSGLEALRLSMLLAEKRATVVIYGYCISACALTFFIASGRTHVTKDALVAWHHGWSEGRMCDEIHPRTKRLTRTWCGVDYHPELRKLGDAFFPKRVVILQNFGLDHPPQSVQMAKVLRSRFEGTGTYPSVVWMWNPRYYRSTLKTDITYESYPTSQDEVDELSVRYFGPGALQILHDP